ncbi:MAG: preprotein translocase subunit YajC [Thermoleophilia bacterium]|nr:preprotein translocase subunit YajC [Thermoleophilia bacterium]
MTGSSWMLIIYVVAFIGIFYFMAIRPQQRQRRAHQALLSSLKKGDRIVTASGIYGTVKRVEESMVVVEVAKGVNMKIARRAVAEIIRDSAEARAVAPEGSTTTRGKRGKAQIEESTTDEIDAEADESAEDGEEDTWNQDIWKKDE